MLQRLCPVALREDAAEAFVAQGHVALRGGGLRVCFVKLCADFQAACEVSQRFFGITFLTAPGKKCGQFIEAHRDIPSGSGGLWRRFINRF